MILAFLLGAADPEWERLFGDPAVSEATSSTAAAPAPAMPADAAAPAAAPASSTASATAPPAGGPPEIPGFVAPIVILGAAAMAAVALRRTRVRQAQSELRVLHREALGDRSALVLVEVVTGEGELRRLLIGTGGGPPSLVSDLGGGFDPPAVASVRAAPPAPDPAPSPDTVRPLRPSAGNIAEEILAERRSRGRFLTVAGEDE